MKYTHLIWATPPCVCVCGCVTYVTCISISPIISRVLPSQVSYGWIGVGIKRSKPFVCICTHMAGLPSWR